VIQTVYQISTIFDMFGLIFTNYTDEIYRYTDCNVDQRVCSVRKILIEDIGTVQPDWFLEIPEVNEKEKCESVDNSYWISVNP